MSAGTTTAFTSSRTRSTKTACRLSNPAATRARIHSAKVSSTTKASATTARRFRSTFLDHDSKRKTQHDDTSSGHGPEKAGLHRRAFDRCLLRNDPRSEEQTSELP